MNYYRNFSKISDQLFSTFHRQSNGGTEEYFIGKKCLIPTFNPPRSIDIKNDGFKIEKEGGKEIHEMLFRRNGERGRGSTVAFIMEDLKNIKHMNIKKDKNEKYTSIMSKNKNKTNNNTKKSLDSNENSKEQGREEGREQGREQGSAIASSKKSVSLSDSTLFHTPDDLINTNQKIAVRKKRIDSGAFSVSSAGTDSQIKTPTQTQVHTHLYILYHLFS